MFMALNLLCEGAPALVWRAYGRKPDDPLKTGGSLR
jgi:hypothetical protein